MPMAPRSNPDPAKRNRRHPTPSFRKTTPIVKSTPRAGTRSSARLQHIRPLSPRPAPTAQSARTKWKRTLEAETDKPEDECPSAELQEIPPQPQYFQLSPTAPTPIPPLAATKRKRTNNSEAETEAGELEDVRPRKHFRGLLASTYKLYEGDLQEDAVKEQAILQERDQPFSPEPRGQKRFREAGSITSAPFSKRTRSSPVEDTATRSTSEEASFGGVEAPIDPIDYWRKQHTWPKKYSEPNNMIHLLARRKSKPSLRRKRSESGSLAARSATPSDQKPRDEKIAPYRDARFEAELETNGIFMIEDREGPRQAGKDVCRNLLDDNKDVPQISRFSDEVFKSSCRRIQNRNEAKVIQDITRLIVPSAEELADSGAESLEPLIEAVNEGWNNSIPVAKSRPQPDYSVGFKRTAFTKGQLDKLGPFIGQVLDGDQSFFMATYYMYFPFLTCEVKCGATALDIADRQNAHSMALAVRAVVELFRLVKREAEIHREILAFSVSHDHRSVRIYGHYAAIDGLNTTFYRHPIRTFDFTELDGREKWTAYKFTKSVYETWMPTHLMKLCSAIDDLPLELGSDVLPLAQGSGLSQDFTSQQLSQSFAESTSQVGDGDTQVDSGDEVITPNTSVSRREPRKSRKHNR